MSSPHGIIPALVTPLTESGDLLKDGLRDVLDFTIDRGVHGIFVLGSSGEIYGLDEDQKRRVVEIAVEHVAGRVPVYAGASEITTRDCLRASADDRGGGRRGQGLSVLTPYFMTPTQGELVTHFREIAGGTDLPVLLYNNPGRTHVELSVETVLELAEVDGVVGLKDSAGDLERLRTILDARPAGFTVLVGLDTHILPPSRPGPRGRSPPRQTSPRRCAERGAGAPCGDGLRGGAHRLFPSVTRREARDNSITTITRTIPIAAAMSGWPC